MRERQLSVTETFRLPAAAAADGHNDESVTMKEHLFHVCLGEMIYQFLIHAIDSKHSNLLIDKLATNDILSLNEKQKLREQRAANTKVNYLMAILREKSAAQFESFLSALSESQQSVAEVVKQAQLTVGLTAQNPLQCVLGK